jgi:hypothetical protein
MAYMDALLKGKSNEQANARTEIGLILEARGYLEDAEDMYWTNIQARSTDRRSYDQLVGIYRQRRDRLSETLVLRQLESVFSEAAATQESEASERRGRRRTDHAAASAYDDEDTRGSETAANGSLTPTRRLRRLRSARRDDEAPTPPPAHLPARQAALAESSPATSMLGIPMSRSAAQSATALMSAVAAPLPEQPAMSMLGFPLTQTPTQPALPARRAVQAVPIQPQPIVPDLLDDADGLPADMLRHPRPAGFGHPRRANLAPTHLSSVRSGVMIAAQPMTIGAFLLASIGAAALIALLMFGFGRSVANAAPIPAANSQLPERCASASLRFPGSNDARAAVAAAYRENGVDVDAVRPGSARLTPAAAEQVIGGWIGVSLLLERADQTPPTLTAWLSQQPGGGPTLANALISGRSIDGLLTATEWAQIQALPANTCEGAFLRNPQNATLSHLVDGVIIH